MKNLNLLFKMKRLLKYHSKALGLGYECAVSIQDYSPASKQREDNDKLYSYPECFEIRIENHSNHFYSFRCRDGRMIREGTNLSGKGLSVGQVYRAMRLELRDHADAIFKANLDSITVADIEKYRKTKAGAK